MPTYVCTVSGSSLSAAKKREIAAEITRVHSGLTGAPRSFAQVFFLQAAAGDHFIGGSFSKQEQAFIRGEIRAGRSAEVKRNLVGDLVRGFSRISGIPQAGVWVYLNELAAGQMAEYGRVLPEPGGEVEWMASLPAEVRERMGGLGRRSSDRRGLVRRRRSRR